MTDQSIARLYKISRQAVHQLRQRYNIPPVDNKNEERNKQIVQLHHNGESVLKLSKKFKLSPTHIYRILKQQ